MRNYRIILLRGLTENMKSAIIMDIQRYSIHDGPGIRTTVFFKGCHMACRWCHNPESQRREPELLFYENRCINCGECMLLCRKNAHSMESGKHRIDLSLCAGCPGREACSRICPAEAIKLCGDVYKRQAWKEPAATPPKRMALKVMAPAFFRIRAFFPVCPGFGEADSL